MSDQFHENDLDVFEDDLFFAEDESNYQTIGRWGILLIHLLKGAFVLYSGAHNIQAALTATGGSLFAISAQIIGVLVLEASISALYMAGMAGKITGKLQSLVAAFFWLIGMALAGMGIVADSRLHAGYELGSLMQWHLSTGLYLAPLVMVFGLVLVVFTDPVLAQQIANARDRALIRREKVRARVLADKYNHQSRRIVHNIRLGAQKQMAVFAREYYKSDDVQAVLQETAVRQLQAVMRQAGIDIPGQPDGAASLPTPAPDDADTADARPMAEAAAGGNRPSPFANGREGA